MCSPWVHGGNHAWSIPWERWKCLCWGIEGKEGSPAVLSNCFQVQPVLQCWMHCLQCHLYENQLESWLLHFWSSPLLMHLQKQRKLAKLLGPHHHMWDPDGFPGLLTITESADRRFILSLFSSPYHHIHIFCLFLPFCLLKKQIFLKETISIEAIPIIYYNFLSHGGIQSYSPFEFVTFCCFFFLQGAWII